MSMGTLREFAALVDGRLFGDDRSFVGVSTDTRTIRPGQLYIALRGPRFDGHRFVADAPALGAAGAVVSERQDADLPQVLVDDTRVALGRFAGAWRARFAIDTVAVTGSNGKTSVKEMVASILRRGGDTLATRGNFNNDIGVPLTLLRLNRHHRAAVIEIGASAPGEVAQLAALAAPRVVTVTNAAPAHLEGFGSIEAVAQAKGEIFAALPGDGTAVINADDAFAPLWRRIAGERRILTFGTDDGADFWFSDFSQTVAGGSASIRFRLHTPAGDATASLPVGGRHNARNAACAAAVAYALGVGLDDIVAGLAAADSVAGRLQVLMGLRGARIIDDSYNANPASARAAIEFLAEQNEPAWLVLGDMRELGEDASRMHAQIGKHARECGIERLYAVGELSRAAAVAFGDGGRWFEALPALIDALRKDLHANLNVLVKASRSMHLEKVVAALRPADVDLTGEC